MDHWFDRLAQPHTRRTTLKALALGGAALALPDLRVPQASATTGEPCYNPCVNAAGKAWQSELDAVCKPLFRGGILGAVSGSVIQTWLSVLSGWHCDSSAELTWHRAIEACRGSECGDPATYPGGQAPKPPAPKCLAGQEVVCGDRCCDVIAECCACSSEPSGFCCCAAGKCGSTGCI